MAEYLDKEAFKKSVDELYCKSCKAEKKDHNGCWCRACWVDDMLDEVECFQPADVTPVRHGRWIERKRWAYGKWSKWIECSECNYADYNADMYEDIPFTFPGNYCPNCGAKMDGGAEDACL